MPSNVMDSPLLDSLFAQLKGQSGIASQVQAVGLTVFVGLGLFRAVAWTSSVLNFVWRQYLRPAVALKKYGQWAIVTGATDGIGREYCNCLAKKGLNIYLVSRTEAKLQEAAAQIAQKYGVETKYYAADLAAAGKEPIEESCWYGLKSNINGMDIGLLVNNAGMSYDHAEYLHLLDSTVIDNMVSLNMTALTKMAYIVLPGMVERGRGAIVNIGSASFSAMHAAPFLSIYAASKAYVEHFSACLGMEYESKGIHVQCQTPNLVVTKLSKVKRRSFINATVTEYVANAVRHIGYETISCPYPSHAFMQFFLKTLIPKGLSNKMIYGNTWNLRRRALKKKEAQAKAQ